LFVILALIYFTKAFLHSYLNDFTITTLYDVTKPEDSFFLLRIINFAIYAISAWLVLLRPNYRHKLVAIVVQQRLLLCFFGLILLSALWSIDPATTIRRFAALSGTTLFAMYFFVRFSVEEQFRLLSSTLALLACMNLALILFFPSIGVDTYHNVGAWRGGFLHKWGLCMTAGLGLILVLGWPRSLKRPKSASPWLAILYGILVFNSKTVGVWVALVGTASIMPWMFFKWRNSNLVIATCAFLSIGAGVTIYITLLYFNELLDFIGRDISFSGRVPFWKASLEYISGMEFLVGYGYDSFALSLDNYRLRFATGFMARGMHNGYLEILFDTGLISLLTFLTILTRTGYVLLRRLPMALVDFSGVATLIFLYIIILNFSGSSFAQSNDVNWVLLVLVFSHAAVSRNKSALMPTALRLSKT
jgi:exopolysaccharide production protein ExoQ